MFFIDVVELWLLRVVLVIVIEVLFELIFDCVFNLIMFLYFLVVDEFINV